MPGLQRPTSSSHVELILRFQPWRLFGNLRERDSDRLPFTLYFRRLFRDTLSPAELAALMEGIDLSRARQLSRWNPEKEGVAEGRMG